MLDRFEPDSTLTDLEPGYIVHSWMLEGKDRDDWQNAPMKSYFVRSVEKFGDGKIVYLAPLNAFRSPPLDPYPLEEVLSCAQRIQVTRSSPEDFETGQAYRVIGTIPGTLIEYFKIKSFTDEGANVQTIGGDSEFQHDEIPWEKLCHRVSEPYDP